MCTVYHPSFAAAKCEKWQKPRTKELLLISQNQYAQIMAVNNNQAQDKNAQQQPNISRCKLLAPESCKQYQIFFYKCTNIEFFWKRKCNRQQNQLRSMQDITACKYHCTKHKYCKKHH